LTAYPDHSALVARHVDAFARDVEIGKRRAVKNRQL
jgi:hypothetical protein